MTARTASASDQRIQLYTKNLQNSHVARPIARPRKRQTLEPTVLKEGLPFCLADLRGISQNISRSRLYQADVDKAAGLFSNTSEVQKMVQRAQKSLKGSQLDDYISVLIDLNKASQAHFRKVAPCMGNLNRLPSSVIKQIITFVHPKDVAGKMSRLSSHFAPFLGDRKEKEYLSAHLFTIDEETLQSGTEEMGLSVEQGRFYWHVNLEALNKNLKFLADKYEIVFHDRRPLIVSQILWLQDAQARCKTEEEAEAFESKIDELSGLLIGIRANIETSIIRDKIFLHKGVTLSRDTCTGTMKTRLDYSEHAAEGFLARQYDLNRYDDFVESDFTVMPEKGAFSFAPIAPREFHLDFGGKCKTLSPEKKKDLKLLSNGFKSLEEDGYPIGRFMKMAILYFPHVEDDATFRKIQREFLGLVNAELACLKAGKLVEDLLKAISRLSVIEEESLLVRPASTPLRASILDPEPDLACEEAIDPTIGANAASVRSSPAVIRRVEIPGRSQTPVGMVRPIPFPRVATSQLA